MAEAATKMSKKAVVRYASDQLHAVRPQPAGIPAMLSVENALDASEAEAEAEKQEDPPKDVARRSAGSTRP
jgi:hypothetical protein